MDQLCSRNMADEDGCSRTHSCSLNDELPISLSLADEAPFERKRNGSHETDTMVHTQTSQNVHRDYRTKSNFEEGSSSTAAAASAGERATGLLPIVTSNDIFRSNDINLGELSLDTSDSPLVDHSADGAAKAPIPIARAGADSILDDAPDKKMDKKRRGRGTRRRKAKNKKADRPSGPQELDPGGRTASSSEGTPMASGLTAAAGANAMRLEPIATSNRISNPNDENLEGPLRDPCGVTTLVKAPISTARAGGDSGTNGIADDMDGLRLHDWNAERMEKVRTSLESIAPPDLVSELLAVWSWNSREDYC
jgi:hypothetical protein